MFSPSSGLDTTSRRRPLSDGGFTTLSQTLVGAPFTFGRPLLLGALGIVGYGGAGARKSQI